jgi:hypothetical protein
MELYNFLCVIINSIKIHINNYSSATYNIIHYGIIVSQIVIIKQFYILLFK